MRSTRGFRKGWAWAWQGGRWALQVLAAPRPGGLACPLTTHLIPGIEGSAVVEQQQGRVHVAMHAGGMERRLPTLPACRAGARGTCHRECVVGECKDSGAQVSIHPHPSHPHAHTQLTHPHPAHTPSPNTHTQVTHPPHPGHTPTPSSRTQLTLAHPAHAPVTEWWPWPRRRAAAAPHPRCRLTQRCTTG